MRSDAAYVLANPFLYHFQNKSLLNIEKGNLCKALLFKNVCCRTDDLWAISGYLEFDKNLKNVDELILENG